MEKIGKEPSIDKGAEAMEKRAIAEKNPEFAGLLKEDQVIAMLNAGFESKLSVRAASDEELIKIDGIGAATVIKLREWSVFEVPEGDAISLRHLALNDGTDTPYNVNPGDIIPAHLGAEDQVNAGRAIWK